MSWRHKSQAPRLSKLFQTNSKRFIRYLNYCPSERGIYRSPVGSPHKGPIRRTVFLYHDVIMYLPRRGNWRKRADTWQRGWYGCEVCDIYRAGAALACRRHGDPSADRNHGYSSLHNWGTWNAQEFCKHKSKINCDVIKWKHFPRYWPFVRGIHRSPVNSPHKG